MERNDQAALATLRQYIEARNQIGSIRMEQSARTAKVHADHRAGLIDDAALGSSVMDAGNFGEGQIVSEQETVDRSMALLQAWHRGENIILAKLST